MAKFFEHCGRRIFEGCGVLWYSVPNGFLASLPFQQPLDPSQEEVRALLRSSDAAGVRFPSLQWHGIEGGVYLHCGLNYTLQSINANHRPRVRKGMETFEVRQVPEEVLLQQGIQLIHNTMRRQIHYDPEFGDPDRWPRLVKAIRCLSPRRKTGFTAATTSGPSIVRATILPGNFGKVLPRRCCLLMDLRPPEGG
jgi:hypothetical protein